MSPRLRPVKRRPAKRRPREKRGRQRLRNLRPYLVGMVLVLLACGALYVYQDHNDSRRTAASAKIRAETYQVGLGHSGIVTKQLVRRGDYVTRGQILGHYKSSTLIGEIRTGELVSRDLPYRLNKDNELVLTAPRDGRIESVNYTAGSFVPANHDIYEVIDEQSAFVDADFSLSESQVKLINRHSPVRITLPDGTKTSCRINDLSVKPKGGRYAVETECGLEGRFDFNTFTIGSPVSAQVILEEDTAWTRLTD